MKRLKTVKVLPQPEPSSRQPIPQTAVDRLAEGCEPGRIPEGFPQLKNLAGLLSGFA
jgi:hypothetical protein